MMDMQKIMDFNQDQIQHINLVQGLCWSLCKAIMEAAISHDESKFSEKEYVAFVDARDSLRASRDGEDADYQKNLKSDAIQHHITTNPHHPEYWDKEERLMPFVDAIIMFFDWHSRSLVKPGDFWAFWDYNLKKLEKQPHARATVEAMRACLGINCPACCGRIDDKEGCFCMENK